jgi:hypothetical protein
MQMHGYRRTHTYKQTRIFGYHTETHRPDRRRHTQMQGARTYVGVLKKTRGRKEYLRILFGREAFAMVDEIKNFTQHQTALPRLQGHLTKYLDLLQYSILLDALERRYFIICHNTSTCNRGNVDRDVEGKYQKCVSVGLCDPERRWNPSPHEHKSQTRHETHTRVLVFLVAHASSTNRVCSP